MMQKLQIIKMEDSKYQRLLQNQYKCIKADREQIQLTAKRLRDLLFNRAAACGRTDERRKKGGISGKTDQFVYG